MSLDYTRYPPNWSVISEYIRFFRASGRCEGSPTYPNCRAEHLQLHPVTGSRVILTTAHLGIDWPDGTPGDKHNKWDCRPQNLRAWCQRCHLNYDLADHVAHATQTRRRKQMEAGQIQLPFEIEITK